MNGLNVDIEMAKNDFSITVATVMVVAAVTMLRTVNE